jgi:maltoporin
VQYPRSLNLNGMGSIGGRMEESDYFELAAALHFAPVNSSSDTTEINVQARFAMYTTQGQIIGNVTSNSYGGITVALPELFAEVRNIMGGPWSVWVGARFFRGEDIHIIDHFYFDDHSSQDLACNARIHSSPLCFRLRLIPHHQCLLTFT